MLGVNRVVDAVSAVYGIETHIADTVNKIMDAAGYGDGVDDDDPTKAS
jgi:hypothetical protein